jgi:hypothetical protein
VKRLADDSVELTAAERAVYSFYEVFLDRGLSCAEAFDAALVHAGVSAHRMGALRAWLVS